MIPYQTEILATIGMLVAFYLGTVWEAYQQRLDAEHYESLSARKRAERMNETQKLN